ncbi:LrgB family protein [Alteromonas ponticola]|uniref:LrgB family protein n=1 Tax=Alteromonas aquimaris TaxID=2998417 RepID=A0ABT3P2E1_9ALTE|nr:LrgB family protein [Alteromonas aquimaris]MCW8106929.1 LrgB family protein [Alteromonas aquimaris]
MSEIINPLVSVVKSVITFNAVLWITLSIAIYMIASRLYAKTKGHPLTLPLLTSALALGGILHFLNIPVADYQQSTRLIHWLLGPVTVALAVPLYFQCKHIANLGWRLWLAIFAGGVFAPALAWAILYWSSVPVALSTTMLVKSITTPLAMETAELIGGIPAMAAVFVIFTGMVGAIVAPWVFKWLGGDNAEAQGVALGTVAHAIGTAKALQISELTGALAAISLSLNGIMTAFILPMLISTLG